MVKRKSFILSLCVVLMIFITTTITFSLSNPNIEITYGNETYESNEAFKMQWYSNDDEIKFTVNLSKQYESYVGNGGTLSSEEVPFKVKAKYNANKKEKEFKDDLISIKELENALYEVTIKNQLVENDDIYIDVIMESSNIWAAEKFTKSFNIKVDKTAPIINIIDFPEDNAVVISNKLNLSFKVTEDNLNKDHITIVDKKNGETVNIDWKLEQKGNVLTYIADSLESGVYEFEISAEDMAGNKAVIIKNDSEIGECFKSIFQFQRSGKLDFFDVPAEGIFKEEVLFKGYIYFIRDIDIYYSVNDGIKEKIDTKYDVITKRVSFEKKFNEDGKYKVWAEWKQNDNAEKVIYDIGTYIVDKNAPIITINNVAEGNNEPLENKRYEETVKVSISVEDDNLVYDRDGKLNEEKNKIIISYADGTEEIKTFHNTTTVLDTIEEAICDISVESTDAAGNSSKEKRSIIVDSRAPEIKVNFEEVNQFNHYNKEVKFTASITDATLSFDDANAYNELELVKLNSNGDETVAKVIDLKNGYADEDINISSWSIADVSERKGTITAKISGTINKEFDGNFILRVRSKDSCNHESSLEKAFTIDNKAPVVTYNGKDKLLNKYKTAKDIDILIEEENLYSAEIICKISNENKDSEVVYESKVDLNSQEINNKTIIKKLKLDEDGHYELTVKAKDKAGNEYSKVQEFVIDSGKPKITVDGVDVTKNEIVNSYKESKEITVTVRDLTLDKNNTTLVLKRNGEEVTKVVGDKWGRGLYKVSNNITINIEDEGLYTLEVTAKDRVNEEASYVTTTFEIDGTKPVVNIDGVIDNEVITLQNLVDKLKISVEEKNYFHEEYSPEFKITKNNKDVLYLEYKKEEIINISEKEIKRVFAEDGHYKIEVTAEDKAGNKADKNKLILEFVVDNEPPEILFSGIDDNSKNGFNDNRNLSITVNEANYSTNNVVITAEKDDKDYYVGEFISNNISSIFTKEFKEDGYYEIKVEAIDGAGNRTEKNISFLIDISGPGLIINGFENGIYNEESAFTHYNTTRNVEVKLTDKNFKLDENGDFVKPTFEIYDHSKGTNVTDAIVGDNSWNISDEEMILKFDITAVSEDGKYEIKFNYTDECGNRSDYENLYVVIDGVNPEISLSGIEDKSFNNISKSLMIKVLERNFESNTVIINGTKDGEAFDIGSFTSTLEESKLTYNFTEEGLYTFEVLSKDFAGNEAITKNISFTIDKTNPEINIAGVIDGESYNVSKAVDISILDRNHNLNKVTVTKDGLEMNIGSFSLSEDMALLSYNFSEEGDYVITVNSTDKAENSSSKSVKFTIDKTSPVITPMISGKDTVIKDGAYINEVFTPYFKLDESEDTITSVIMNGNDVTGKVPAASKEGKYTFDVEAADKAGNKSKISVSFTVDVTNPEVVISGIIDGFFNKNVKPVYKITDTNLDSSKTSVTLNGENFKSGTSIKEEGQYVLKAVGTDLATNETKRTIIFTVDKTSPKIEFVEPIDGKYFNTSIIPELLIEDLSEYTVISQTLNGEPYELGDEITEDGKYVLSLEVVDKSGNNTELSVEFIIDQTPPKFIYSGAENGGKYYETVNLTVSLENPFDTIKEVLVNGEVAEADFVEENGQMVVKMKFAEIGTYKLDLYAVDDAGNETRDVFTLEVSEKTLLAKLAGNGSVIVDYVIVGMIILVIIIAFIINRLIKKRQIAKAEEKREKEN